MRLITEKIYIPTIATGDGVTVFFVLTAEGGETSVPHIVTAAGGAGIAVGKTVRSAVGESYKVR